MKKKKVWIVGHYTMPPEYEVRVKTLMWAKYLMKEGYDVTLISASTLHNTDINLITGTEKYIFKQYEQYRFIHIKCSDYSGSGIKRVRNLLQFAYRFKKYAKEFGTLPDVILAADIHCIDYKPIGEFAKKNHIKFIVDIRDLWPESIVEYLGYSKKNPIIKYLYHREKTMYQMADDIIFSMEGGKDYIVDQGWQDDIDLSKVHHINNGIDLEEYEYNKKNIIYHDADLEDTSTFKVVYIGSIRRVNNLEIILNVAEILKEHGYKKEKIKLLIYGDGDQKEYLIKQIEQKKIDNIIFKKQVEKKYIPYILSKCNLNLLHGASINLGRYGLSLNKSFDYLASGKPILSDIKCNYDYIESNQSGIVVADNSQEIYKGILCFFLMNETKYCKYCEAARKTAQNYDFYNLTQKLTQII